MVRDAINLLYIFGLYKTIELQNLDKIVFLKN